MGCSTSKTVHIEHKDDMLEGTSVGRYPGILANRGRVGATPISSSSVENSSAGDKNMPQQEPPNTYRLVEKLALGLQEFISDDSSEGTESPKQPISGGRAYTVPSITSSSSEDECSHNPTTTRGLARKLASPGESSLRDNQSMSMDGVEESVVDWLAESSGTTLFTSTTVGEGTQQGCSVGSVAHRDLIITGGSDLNDVLALPQKETTLLPDSIVKDTTRVERRHAPLPSNTPLATKGDWLRNRYVVNDYIVLSRLGQGAHSEVRLCKHKTSNELFACKILNRKLLESNNVDIQREVSIMRNLRHRNILRLYEVLDDPKVNKVYLITELAKNDLHSGVLSDQKLRGIIRQVIEGLLYLHMNNIVHNDLKPSNILIVGDGTVKIADFGVSGTGRVRLDSAGTPAFMAPEVVTGEPHDGQLADCYALGATIFCLRFGRPPFVGRGNHNGRLLDLYEQIKNAPLQFPDTADSELVDLISRLMKRDPRKRMGLIDALRHTWLNQ